MDIEIQVQLCVILNIQDLKKLLTILAQDSFPYPYISVSLAWLSNLQDRILNPCTKYFYRRQKNEMRKTVILI